MKKKTTQPNDDKVTAEVQRHLEDVQNKAEDQFRKAGAAHSALSMQILTLALGGDETTKKLQKALDPEVSHQTEMRDMLQRLDADAARIRADKARLRQQAKKKDPMD